MQQLENKDEVMTKRDKHRNGQKGEMKIEQLTRSILQNTRFLTILTKSSINF